MCLVHHYIDENGVSYYGFDAFWRWLLAGCPKNPSQEEILRRSRKSNQFGRPSSSNTSQQRASSTDLHAWRVMAEDYYPGRKSQETTDAVELEQRRSLSKTETERQQLLINQEDGNV
ncbi:hypothetical protein Gasu2_02960 [Galdieria sulphuraria]|uniref:Uncharacterized protein n=1 Tax=Galdieria sulphuraria TaxID=130081 RepID=M2WZ84_GALSU|nr:uncharacterized protein Gasu_32040 [Galdieria sulphuraria]EME29375.1 hypothetical protein Gasu_32040 [Galdieria sulphuraria]GJD05847.1 hypothetical protein Gasu2_02960 [Galdieria sulphuraria]|eukprot:XP_005705895.1 hypothetical protein Gasu_32040 [Galdieria sulphuraria]